ncbi:hypothetical protein ACROYT_G015004 [Oculina patagonica]
MAAVSPLSVDKEEETIELNENDIPGAKLTKPAEQCTVSVLKRWLSCRGAKVTGKREDLVARVNDYIKNGMDKDIVDPDGGVNIAKKRKLLGVAEVVDPEKHEYGKKEKKHFARGQDDGRAPHQRTITDSELKDFHDQVKKVELATGKKIGLSFILPHSLPESNSQEPATQHHDNDVNILQKCKLVSPDKVHPMSIGDISLKAERVKKRLFKAASERNEIEKETRDQHTSVLWYNIRQPRITASQCKRCLLREATSPTKAISEVLMYKPIIQTRLMKEGIEMEPKIIEQFSKETGNVVRKCGFFLSETHPFLGASPDGITERGRLVEVKKVTSKEGESMEDTLCRLGIYKQMNNNIVLNKNHKYFYQIQQQLFCSNYKESHFIVSNGVWLNHEVVEFDNTFWHSTLQKLEKFFLQNIFPEVVYPRVLHGQTRWNKEIDFPPIRL